jgi:hypothetical protein
VRLARLNAGDVVRFVQRQAPQLHLKRAKLLTSALRSFLRYARYRGAVVRDLAAAVPIVANWSMPSIPRAIGAEQVRRLLTSIDRHTAIGRRDHAILLLLARLGLRSGEVAFLELEDINWDAGQVKANAAIEPPFLCRSMSGRRSPRTCATDGRAAPVVACFCAAKLPSVAFWASVVLDRLFGMRSSAPASRPRQRALISFVMHWRLLIKETSLRVEMTRGSDGVVSCSQYIHS